MATKNFIIPCKITNFVPKKLSANCLENNYAGLPTNKGDKFVINSDPRYYTFLMCLRDNTIVFNNACFIDGLREFQTMLDLDGVETELYGMSVVIGEKLTFKVDGAVCEIDRATFSRVIDKL